MEKGIQYLSELAVQEMVYYDPDKAQLPKDADEVHYILAEKLTREFQRAHLKITAAQSPGAWGDGSWQQGGDNATAGIASNTSQITLLVIVDNAGKGTDRGAEMGVCIRTEDPEPGLPNFHALLEEQRQKTQLLLEEVAQLRAEMSSAKKEVNQAVSETASEVYVEMSDWALKSSGATIDVQRTSETYECKENWGCRVLWFFRTANPPDAILQPDVSPGNCWPLQGHQGQVVIRLPARVHLTAVTVQHISKDISPSGTVASAPRDVTVFGVDADVEEETLLGTFMYNVAKEAIQTFPLKNAPLPRAFSYVKLVVKSNWGNPAYTCIYRVQVHGKMAKPESLN
ncbi:sperm-associated antigen 4 protein-like [Sarcoramphus papa]